MLTIFAGRAGDAPQRERDGRDRRRAAGQEPLVRSELRLQCLVVVVVAAKQWWWYLCGRVAWDGRAARSPLLFRGIFLVGGCGRAPTRGPPVSDSAMVIPLPAPPATGPQKRCPAGPTLPSHPCAPHRAVGPPGSHHRTCHVMFERRPK